MRSPSSRLRPGMGTDADGDPWERPAASLRASAADVIEGALLDETDPYGRLQVLAGLDQACRTIARAVKDERVALVRQLVAEHGVPATAAMLQVDSSTIRHMAPQGRWQRAAHPKARDKQAVQLYSIGHSVDATAKHLKMGHRRVKRVLLAAGVELRETHERGDADGE